MLEVYPEKVAKLSPEGFARITITLDFGLRHQVRTSVKNCLRYLQTMLEFLKFHEWHWTEK